ncbi:3-deoxy-D-manno-octulosonic acid kinase [Psychrobium sp. 1_MG-2023]|uniref:3-deoxy-D-manno-octulosonic acid kinase n=1 Tax=Psychrobium sp. 1_MG-2023 TaxID=3062624 RepID=UPI0026929BB0|nr:3-deoxy-D-manno-octulosonic acid kinase [Psychrobium sp. 1_MG-2023]MDP2562531.1 3-deoxy-D-manno-octulosonic acid kinase [Psychrobium sp. 1_MG-2023]
MQPQITQLKNRWLISSPQLDVTPSWFDAVYWQEQGKILGQSHGRNVTWFVGDEQAPMVLRHYYRGGLIGKLINDAYLFSGLKSSRAYKEFTLLHQLEQLNLPACRAIAAQVVRNGLVYRADLLMKMVDGGRDLVAILTEAPLPCEQWQAIGETIALFHQHKVYHADLNAHNILLDGNDKPCLIDFDRGEIKATAGQWCQDNLDRLLRSFNKEKNKLDRFNFTSQNWDSLMRGYNREIIN